MSDSTPTTETPRNYLWHISWSYGERWPSDGVHEAVIVAPTADLALAIAKKAAVREGCVPFGFDLISQTGS